jgi:phosphoglycerate dehydrogenase-like enzyme
MRLVVSNPSRHQLPFGELLPEWDVTVCAPRQLAEYAPGADVICPIAAPVDAELIAACEFGLVQQFGVGLENVDVDSATKAGVWVARVAGDASGNADSVAELAILLALALGRRLDETRRALAESRWAEPLGTALLDGTVAIVGLGAIGQAVARRLSGWGIRLLAVRAHPEMGGPPGVDVVGPDRMPEVLAESDVVISALMYTESSRNLFDADAFAAMKPGALFVNVARGGLVDEDALLAALESGQVGGAGLDVHAVEPARPDSPLLRHPRVIATPHIGGITGISLSRTAKAAADNMLRWAAGDSPRWAVNTPAEVPRRNYRGGH